MYYTINGTQYSSDSRENQHILDGFVNREVYCCMTSEVEYMLKHQYDGDDDNPIDPTDTESFGYIACPYCGEPLPPYEAENEENCMSCDNCGHQIPEEEYNAIDYTYPDIFEWWAVSGWLGEKLNELSDPVIPAWGKSYWGRTTSGQAIASDYVIAKIAFNMGILDGQPYSWSKKQ